MKKSEEVSSEIREERKKRKKNSLLGSYDVLAMPSRADVDWSRASWSAQFDEACACQRLDDELEKVIRSRKSVFPPFFLSWNECELETILNPLCPSTSSRKK